MNWSVIGILYNFSFFCCYCTTWLYIAPVILWTNPGYLQVWSKSGVVWPGEEYGVVETVCCTMLVVGMLKTVSSQSVSVKDPLEVSRASSLGGHSSSQPYIVIA